ncbi:hypothetical protein SAMN04489761_4644 [Tenacibaculum sp. MAR_2009_124]|nr:hypothetical protein [Tenacibaculum sp. MAR_2009_124]SED21352.1 hypothetical protein SAMN04489761_4644 [Tenacibaculum sp. MAR_2009_124]
MIKNFNQSTVTYTNCNGSNCQTFTIEGDKLLLPLLFGVAVGLAISKSFN